MSSTIAELIQHNPVITVGLAAVTGSLLARIKSLSSGASQLISHYLTCTITTTTDDALYPVIINWTKRISSLSQYRKINIKSVTSTRMLNAIEDRYEISPGVGSYFCWWKYRLLWITQNRIQSRVASDKDSFINTLTITVIGRNVTVLKRMVEDAIVLDDQTKRRFAVFMIISTHSPWANVVSHHTRLLSSLTYKPGLIENVVDDYMWFENSRQWYIDHGISYHRGYLFSGPPGTGKTSLIISLAAQLKLKVYVIHLSSIGSEKELERMIYIVPEHSIILLEDIDAIQKSRKTTLEIQDAGDLGYNFNVPLSSLLNCLDGITTQEGRVFMMTTNYPDRLDPALLRPGRVDRHFVLDNLCSSDQLRMANKFYKQDTFVPLDHPVSPAELQAAFMQHPDDPAQARQVLLDRFSDYLEATDEINNKETSSDLESRHIV